jgi:transglutaminase-like putative cysteine protease
MMGMNNEPLDTYRSPMRTVGLRAGDCDDMSALLVAMGKIAGFPTALRVVSKTGKTWDHIYCLFGTPKTAPQVWIPLDPTVETATPGWEPPLVKKPRPGAAVKRQDFWV